MSKISLPSQYLATGLAFTPLAVPSNSSGHHGSTQIDACNENRRLYQMDHRAARAVQHRPDHTFITQHRNRRDHLRLRRCKRRSVPSARRPVSSMGRRAQSQRHSVRHDPGIMISDSLHAVTALVSNTVSAPVSDDAAAVSRVDLEPMITYHVRTASMVSLCVSTARKSFHSTCPS